MWLYRAESPPRRRLAGCTLIVIFGRAGSWTLCLWKQAVEGVRLGMGVWGRNSMTRWTCPELARAIIQDEPIKMRRLGGLYHIDVEALSDVWILKNLDRTGTCARVGGARSGSCPPTLQRLRCASCTKTTS